MRKKFVVTILMLLFVAISSILPVYASFSTAKQPILSELETKLDSNSTKEGQEFSAKLMEDVFYDGQTLIPKSSIVCGSVLKVQKSGVMKKDAFIKLQITEIKTADGKTISIKEKPMIVEVSQPAYNNKKESFIKGLPATIAGSACSITLGKFSSIADAAVFAISTGARITISAISGIIVPDEGKSRAETSAEMVYNSTPLGAVSAVTKKGDDICINPGQYICIFFDSKTVEYIKENIL